MKHPISASTKPAVGQGYCLDARSIFCETKAPRFPPAGNGGRRQYLAYLSEQRLRSIVTYNVFEDNMVLARDGLSAWSTLLASEICRWPDTVSRFAQDSLTSVECKAKFQIERTSKFFCIGSCFARNIEEHIIYQGGCVLSKRIVSPKEEWSGRANGFVNKFTTEAMVNELDWVRSYAVPSEDWFLPTANGYLDLQLSASKPVTLQRAVDRRIYLSTEYFSRIRSADIVIMTLGLTEVWFDTKSGRYLNAAPLFTAVRRQPDRFRFSISTQDTVVSKLEYFRLILKEINPTSKIIISISPVPLSQTFSGLDVCVANNYSKSVLRSAAGEFADRYDDVDYYPSYEMVTMSPRRYAYRSDCLHVSDSAVAEVIRRFFYFYTGESYVIGSFREVPYLEANPDIDAAVRTGELESGFQHWCQYGKNEGRPMRPEGANDRVTELEM